MKQTIELLTKLNAEGIRPPLWLRDDDICTDSPNFRLLLQLSSTGIPIVFAAVPYRAKFSDLEMAFLRSLPKTVYFCVHGYNHINRSESRRPSEYPDSVGYKAAIKEFRYGVSKVSDLVPERFIRMFVPPWNTISPKHLSALFESGIRTISGDVQIPIDVSDSKLSVLSCHVDILDYGEDIWFPLKSNEELDDLFLDAINSWYNSNDSTSPICVLSHHTSMIWKDVVRYKLLIESIANYFQPYSFSDSVLVN